MSSPTVSLKLNPSKLIPTFLHSHFSFSSQTQNSNYQNYPSKDKTQSLSESSFRDGKSRIQNMPRQQEKEPVSIDRIRKDLGEFRRPNAPSVKPVSLQELYKRHVASKERDSGTEANKGEKHSFSAIRDSLRQLSGKNPKTNEDPLSLNKFKESFSLRPTDLRNPGFVIGSPKKLPESVFSKALKEKEGDTSPAMKTEFVKMYSYKELGEKLRKLRPEGKPGGGFTLQELNERLTKLREMEEREMESKIGNVTFRDLRESLVKMQVSEKKQTIKKLDFLNHFGQTPTFMLQPPKEHLVEKYFHPDNMSSAEKLKIELQKVRDEFKMSESDCGSARVQVAQLTTKIKHLATALHPKDKHSRKGLQGMIQQRKKLLKYLRRTDWDSYTLVLSKLSLRDNPDYKN